MPDKETIGFIGLGVMGKPMAGHLVAKGYPRHRPQQEPGPGRRAGRRAERRRHRRRLTSPPAPPASSPCCPTRQTSSACSTVRTASSRRLQPGTILIDTSSIAPATARALAAKAQHARRDDAGCAGERGRSGRGQRVAVDHGRRRPGGLRRGQAHPRRDGQPGTGDPHRRVGRGPDLQGLQSDGDRRDAGRGQRGVRARAQGLGGRRRCVREALLGGFAASKVLDVHGQRMLQSNYTPGFRARLFAKDLRIAGATLAEHATRGAGVEQSCSSW